MKENRYEVYRNAEVIFEGNAIEAYEFTQELNQNGIFDISVVNK